MKAENQRDAEDTVINSPRKKKADTPEMVWEIVKKTDKMYITSSVSQRMEEMRIEASLFA